MQLRKTLLFAVLIFLIIFQSGCAILTTYNDLGKPNYPSGGVCDSKPVFYRAFTFGSWNYSHRGPEKYFRNEGAELEIDGLLKNIPVLSKDISPYPVIEIGSFLFRGKKDSSRYSQEYLSGVEKEWSDLLSGAKVQNDSLVLDIYMVDHDRRMIHGSGTGMYGVMLSGLTLGIIPSYFTYDIEIEAKLSVLNDVKVGVEKMRRTGSHIGSIFLHFHSRAEFIFSEKNPMKNQGREALGRIIGHQVLKLMQNHCAQNQKEIGKAKPI